MWGTKENPVREFRGSASYQSDSSNSCQQTKPHESVSVIEERDWNEYPQSLHVFLHYLKLKFYKKKKMGWQEKQADQNLKVGCWQEKATALPTESKLFFCKPFKAKEKQKIIVPFKHRFV